MNIFKRLFGKKKDNGKGKESQPKVQTETFENDKGTFSINSIDFQSGDIITMSGLKEDGSSSISIGVQSIIFNEPIPDEDDGNREFNPLKIAQKVLEFYAPKPLDQTQDKLFLEALWLTIESDQELPEFKDVNRNCLVDMTKLAVKQDYKTAFELVRTKSKESNSNLLKRSVEPLFALDFPVQTAEFLIELDQYCCFPLIKSLAYCPNQSLVFQLADNQTDEISKVEVLGHSLIYTLDAGQESVELEDRWNNIVSNPWESPINETWLNIEVCQLARKDIKKAEELYNKISREFAPSPNTQRDFFFHLAKFDPDKAMDNIDIDDEIFDVLPALIGCHQAGVDIELKLNEIYNHFTQYSYRPHSAIGWLLKAAILRKDAAYIDKVLEKGGPKGWQTAYYCGYVLGELAKDDPAAAKDLLPILMKPRNASFVAGRDSSVSLVAGTAMRQPQYLKFSESKSIESLAIYAALASRGPQWYTCL